jgi:hypothetical protein
MKSNGGMWRMGMRYGKDYHKALRNALEDFQALGSRIGLNVAYRKSRSQRPQYRAVMSSLFFILLAQPKCSPQFAIFQVGECIRAVEQ